jgi:ABC-2 type transport system ATP-binding protein
MIRVHNLVKQFGSFAAVDNISFDVARGEIFAFLGPNGAGKTTTIRMLTTLLPPTSGTLEIDGLNPAQQQHEVRKRFGIVFQDPSLDQELTAWENLDLHGALYQVPCKVRRERSERLLKQFELWERKDSPVKQFSGGMKRRLEIARGFLHTPKILFLNEPTLGLDPQSRNQLWAHVKNVNQSEGVTVFLTTHCMDEAGPRGAADRGHRPRTHRGDGSPGGTEGTNGKGIAGGRIFGVNRNGYPRGKRRVGGPDATSRKDVEAIVEAIYVLWLRELKRYTRSRAQIIASLGQPLLYLLVLGFGLGPVFQKAGGGSYLQFMAPGVIGMAVLFSSVFSGIALLWDRQFGFLKETLVAPVPRIEVMIGRTLGAATTAMIQGLLVTAVCVIAGFRPTSLAMVPLGFLFLILIAVVFSAMGTTIGSNMQDMQAFPIVMNFLVLPISFCRGRFFRSTTCRGL